jgi:hypothetical protein
MPFLGTTGKNRDRWHGKHVVTLWVALLGLLFVRGVPPKIPHAPGHSNVVTQADPVNKQYFDHEDSQWATRPSSPSAMPPVVASFHPVAAAEPFVETVANGLPYNRPPPLA